MTDTLIGDNDGVYHPALFNDRLLLGLKGTMSEAELHIIRARLDGGIRNKAARGELRRGLPVGFVWGEQDGEVLFHPDEAVTGAIRTVFERFAEFGSARRVWLWFRSEGLSFPLQTRPPACRGRSAGLPLPTPHSIMSSPIRCMLALTPTAKPDTNVTSMNRAPSENGRVICPWTSGRCSSETIIPASSIGPPLRPIRRGSIPTRSPATPGGRCSERRRRHYCRVSPLADIAAAVCMFTIAAGTQRRAITARAKISSMDAACTVSTSAVSVIEQAVADAFLKAITPAAVEAMRLSVEQLQANHDARFVQWRLEVERARYEAERAERRYRAVEPENRLVARGLETEWENRLRDLAAAEMELRRRRQQRPSTISPEQLKRFRALGSDIRQVWTAATTTDRDRKELLRTLAGRSDSQSQAGRRSRASDSALARRRASPTLDVPVPRFQPMGPRTDEDTISLLRRLAALYPDEVIAGILNRQGRKTATGERFTANQVGSLRRYRDIPRFQPPAQPPDGELVPIRKAAQILGMNTSSIHRWLADGFIAGEQVTPGAPWQIRITDELRRGSCSRRRRNICPCWKPP